MHGQCNMNGRPIHPGKNAKPLVIKRHLDILSSPSVIKGNRKSSYKKYVTKAIFSVKSESKICKKKEDVNYKELIKKLDKTKLLKLVSDLFNSYKDFEAKANNKKQDFVTKFPFGRKLLSLDEDHEDHCDSESCSINEVSGDSEKEDDANIIVEKEDEADGSANHGDEAEDLDAEQDNITV